MGSVRLGGCKRPTRSRIGFEVVARLRVTMQAVSALT